MPRKQVGYTMSDQYFEAMQEQWPKIHASAEARSVCANFPIFTLDTNLTYILHARHASKAKLPHEAFTKNATVR
jgi:hypothetical protein